MKKVTVYTTDYCPYCSRAKRLLQSKNIIFSEVDLTRDEALREKLEEQTGWMTVPMIFIGDEFIGGYDNLAELEAEGLLDEKLRDHA